MRLARIRGPQGPVYVVQEGDTWAEIEPYTRTVLPATGPRRLGRQFPCDGSELLAPVEPVLVLGMAHNTGPQDRLLRPQAFQKSPRTVIGPGETIRPEPSQLPLVGECELALVIGRPTHRVSPQEASAHILGWTVANDVTSTAGAARDSFGTESKCGIGFTPVGPWIETDLDVTDLPLYAEIDGVPAASSTVSALARTPAEAVSYLSHQLQLGPGDLILTGAPATSAPLTDGVTMTCRIGGIGDITNLVLVSPEEKPTWQ